MEVTTFVQVGPGWGALLWQEMVGTNEMQFCKLRELCYLPHKVANGFFTSFTQKISKASTSHLCPPIVATWMSALIRDTMLLPEDIAILLTARLRRKADFEVWTYDSENSTRIKCFMQDMVVLCALR